MSIFEYERDAVHVRAKCVRRPKGDGDEEENVEFRKFSVDPNLTSFEILKSLLTRAFDVVGDDYGIVFLSSSNEWLPLVSDWDLDAAIISSSEPHLNLRIIESPPKSDVDDVINDARNPANKMKYFRQQVERTLPSITNRLQRALTIAEESLKSSPSPSSSASLPGLSCVPRNPVGETEFQGYLDKVGELTRPRELRLAVYQGGVEPLLRKVVWKHILGVYPHGLDGKRRIEYIKEKSKEYHSLKQTWMDIILQGSITDDVKFITNMVRKDVLRTDRHHFFFSGDGNPNVSLLFNILTTYALNHPSVGYCQGMSDLLSPLLVTMVDEAHAYISFCALMRRLKTNFTSDGISMTKKFAHLTEAIMYYDLEFFTYLKLHNADDLLFCYRWLLLEMKREFAFDEACRVLEVLWSSLPPSYPVGDDGGLPLYEVKFADSLPVGTVHPRNLKLTETAYAKVAALRKRTTSSSEIPSSKGSAVTRKNSLAANLRPRIRSDGGCVEDGRCLSDEVFSKKAKSADKVKKVVKDLHDFYKLTTSTTSSLSTSTTPASSTSPSSTSTMTTSSTATTTMAEEDPFDTVGYSQANGNIVSVVCNRLPAPTEFGDGNPFLMFLCLSILMQHRNHILKEKFDYQEIAMYFDRLIRRHNVERTLHMARKLFAEYLNEDWSHENLRKLDTNAC